VNSGEKLPTNGAAAPLDTELAADPGDTSSICWVTAEDGSRSAVDTLSLEKLPVRVATPSDDRLEASDADGSSSPVGVQGAAVSEAGMARRFSAGVLSSSGVWAKKQTC